MRGHAVEAARRTGKPLLMIERPCWRAVEGDRWTLVADMSAAARALGKTPRRVLLTVGQKDLAPFAAASQHVYTIRSIDPPADASVPPGAVVITARPPFAKADERRLMEARGIEVLVTKNSGGTDAAAKLAAARALGVRVVMVGRPPPLDLEGVDATQAADAAGAIAWLTARHEAASKLLRV